MEWISVEDRLPEALRPHDLAAFAPLYLVHSTVGVRMRIDDKIADPIKTMRFFGIGSYPHFGGWEYSGVTHWMPLPAPPKEAT